MSSWLRRLSKDRSSKIDPELQIPDQISRPQSNHASSKPFIAKDPPLTDNMRRSMPSKQYHDDQLSDLPNGSSTALEPTPDPLTRAFNEALKPYLDRISLLQGDLDEAHNRINLLKNDLDNANLHVNRLESEKASLHNWIDERGLRPDLPTDLSQSIADSSPVAASILATQLDRKMTMINFSLHHLADSLPNPIPASTVTDTLSTLLPKISYLSTLPAGPAAAFESLIKLGGNLNSHNSGKETEADKAKNAEFFSELDTAMEDVVRKRVIAVGEGEEEWDVAKDIRRLEKSSGFLRKEMGVKNYFLRSLDLMRGSKPQNPPIGGQNEPYSPDSA